MDHYVVRANPVRSRREYNVVRVNPSGQMIRATDLRAGDTIEMEDLGREHVIQGPYRSGRGIRFIDMYGNSIILQPNEQVKLVARENPPIKPKTKLAEIQQDVAGILHRYGMIRPNTRFRETSHGYFQVTGLDFYEFFHNEQLKAELRQLASAYGLVFQEGGGSFMFISQVAKKPAFKNPRIQGGTRAASLQQKLAFALDSAGALTPRTRFRETRIGGIHVTGIDPYRIASDHILIDHLNNLSKSYGFDFKIGAGAFLMEPLGTTTVYAPYGAFNNPRRSGSGRAERSLAYHIGVFPEKQGIAPKYFSDVHEATNYANKLVVKSKSTVRVVDTSDPFGGRVISVMDPTTPLSRRRNPARKRRMTERGTTMPSGRTRLGTHGFYTIDPNRPAIYRSAHKIHGARRSFTTLASAQRAMAQAGAPGAPVINIDPEF